MIDAIMLYLIIGASVWMVMFSLGVIHNAVEARTAHGLRVTGGGLAIATIWMILVWPVFLLALVRGVRR